MSRYESIYPLKLEKGDIIGIAAPSSPYEPNEFENGIEVLRAMGLVPVVPRGIAEKKAFLAGDDAHRAGIINELFADSDVKAIMCARGGYGAMRTLDLIDRENVLNNPKIFLGFSDVTALLNHVHQATGLICFHGPVVCSLPRSDPKSLEALERMMFSSFSGEIHAGAAAVLAGGRSEGILKGGNLATLCHLTGTPHQPDLAGAILMLEDVGEPPYKIDRMLVQMKAAGMFDHINGVALGRFENCGDPDMLAGIFLEIFGDYGIPVAIDFGFGHGKENRVFPLGAPGVMDTESLTVTF